MAKAGTPGTLAGPVIDAANGALAQLEGQGLSWKVTDAEFVAALTQVVDPDGTVVYQTNIPLNAWVIRLTATPQCGNSTFHGLVVFDDDWQTVLNASAAETPVEPDVSGCPSTPLNQDPPPVVPGESVSPPTVAVPGSVDNPVCQIKPGAPAGTPEIDICDPVYLPTVP